MIQNRFYSVIIHITLLLPMVIMVWMFLDMSELKTLNCDKWVITCKCRGENVKYRCNDCVCAYKYGWTQFRELILSFMRRDSTDKSHLEGRGPSQSWSAAAGRPQWVSRRFSRFSCSSVSVHSQKETIEQRHIHESNSTTGSWASSEWEQNHVLMRGSVPAQEGKHVENI